MSNNTFIVCPDDFRIVDGKYKFDRDLETEFVWKRAYKLFYETLKRYERGCVLVGMPACGKSKFLSLRKEYLELTPKESTVYFDATFTLISERRLPITIANLLDKPIDAVVFSNTGTDFDLCRARNGIRSENRRVPRETVLKMFANLQREPPTVNEGFRKVSEVSISVGDRDSRVTKYL